MDSINDQINAIVEYAMNFVGSTLFFMLMACIVVFFIYKKMSNRGG